MLGTENLEAGKKIDLFVVGLQELGDFDDSRSVDTYDWSIELVAALSAKTGTNYSALCLKSLGTTAVFVIARAF